MRRVDAAVVVDTNVVNAAVGLDEVVAGHVNIIVVNVDRGGASIGVGLGRSIGGDTDGVVEIRDSVVGDDVSWSVDLDGVIAADFVGAIGASTTPKGASPSDEQVALLDAAQKDVVGDIEVARSGVFGPDTEANVFEATILDGEANRTGYRFESGEEGDIGVAESESVEDVVGGGADVEQAVVARTIEDDLPVAGGFDGDGFLGFCLQRQPVGAVERRHHRIDVVKTVVAVDTSMDQDCVARLHAALPDDIPVAQASTVVGLKQAGEVGCLLLALVIWRVDMQGVSTVVRLRLGARGNPDGMVGVALGAVGVAEPEAALVFGAGLKVEDAARKAGRDGVIEMLPFTENTLATNTHQG